MNRVTSRHSRLRVERHAVEASRSDSLTGLPNRRAFDAALNRHRRSAKHSGERAAMLIIDVDLFKIINDTYGHTAGDRVRMAFAEVLRAALRRNDIAARMGGDEFAVFLPSGTADDAIAVATRILGGIRPVPHGSDAISYTVSVGSASGAVTPGFDASLLQAADADLYRAKRKNRPKAPACIAAGAVHYHHGTTTNNDVIHRGGDPNAVGHALRRHLDDVMPYCAMDV